MEENNKRYPLVNWVSGMSVGPAHLIQAENHFINALRENQSVGINKQNYGLLPYNKENRVSGDFEISEKVTGILEVRLKKCLAVTSGGYIINFDDQQDNPLTHSFQLADNTDENNSGQEQKWDVILKADPFERVPVGIPDEKESTPRHPDVIPKYALSLLPSGQVNAENLGKYHLIIGRLKKRGSLFEVDGNYIPPCTTMSSHPELKSYFIRFGQFIDSIEKASKEIMIKVQNMDRKSTLALNIDMICRHMMLYISTVYFLYRNEGQYYTPLRFANIFSVLAHTCFVSMYFMNKNDKEELLKYFYEWSDITPGAFESLLAENTGLLYDHTNIRGLMVTIERFLFQLNDLWTTLSRLEYIGKRKENIVIAERSRKSGESPASRWSLID